MKEYSKTSSNGPKTHKLSIVQSKEEIKWFVQSNDPNDFEDLDIQIPSIATELTYNYKQYKAEESDGKRKSIKIPCSPRLLTIANTIRHQVNFSRVPGLGPTLCCAISLGMNQLLAKRAIRELGELSHKFQRMKKQGTSLELYIHSFFESRVDCMFDNGYPKNIELTTEVKKQIDMVSMDTGLFMTSVSLLAIYASLVKQEETPEEFRREWQEHLDRSIATVECKLNAAQSMMKSLEAQNERFL